jgi:RNA polymerase sigma-70 factor (ECF subfamily)
MDNLKKEFGKLYDKYIDKIYRFIYFKVNSPEITEDLCSETFLKGWIAFKDRTINNDGHKKEIENPPAFLYQIARNLVTDFYRKKGKFQIISTEYTGRIADPRLSLEEEANQLSEFSQVKKALSSVKDDYQDIIIWHYLDDLPVTEIAKILDKSEGAVRVMLHRALKALKKELSKIA